MSIREKMGLWQIDFYCHGHRFRRLDFKSKQEAANWRDQIVESLYRGKFIGAGEDRCYTFKQLFDRVYDPQAISKSERMSRRNALDCVDVLGEARPLRTLTQQHIQELIEDLGRLGHSNATINRKISALHMMLIYAKLRGWIKDVPSMKRLSEGDSRIQFLSDDDEQKIFLMLSKPEQEDFRDLVTTLLDIGLHPEEAISLTWEAVSSDRISVSLEKSRNGIPRSVPMSERVKTLLERRRISSENQPKVFGSLTLKAADALWKTLAPCLQIGPSKPPSMKILRDTFCVRLIRSAHTVKEVQELAGHTSHRATQKYSSFSTKESDEILYQRYLAKQPKPQPQVQRPEPDEAHKAARAIYEQFREQIIEAIAGVIGRKPDGTEPAQ